MFRKNALLRLTLLFERHWAAKNLQEQKIRLDIRTFSRLRPPPESNVWKNRTVNKDEYKERMLERARQRRTSEIKEEEFKETEANNPSTAVVVNESMQDQSDYSTEEEEEEEIVEAAEEEAIDAYGLFSALLRYEPPKIHAPSDLYVPFHLSEDDEEYEYKKEVDPTEQWFKNMEEDVRLAKEKEKALYPEEEVQVKMLDFREEGSEGPMILKTAASQQHNKQQTSLYLRKTEIVETTKTKLFERQQSIKQTILEQLDLKKTLTADQALILKEVQSFLDWCMIFKIDIGYAIFRQFRMDFNRTIKYFGRLVQLAPINVSFQQMARSYPKIGILKKKQSLDIGLKCIGSLYPSLNDFEERFKLGLIPTELLKTVIKVGAAFKSAQDAMPSNTEKTLSQLSLMIEEANSVVPNLPKVVESTINGIVAPRTLALVLLNPYLTQKRIESCRKSIHNWANFNLYSHGDFTLDDDETKFKQFCEMYNMTRKLQKECAEEFQMERESNSFKGMNYFQNVEAQTPRIHRHIVGILPKQFVAMYGAYEILKEEGMTWPVFLRGLSILSEQKEVGVYTEIHFYEKLRKSRSRNVVSAVLRDGLVRVMRMMCQEGQLRMKNEPFMTAKPLFELTPTVYEEEIFN
eukprot:g7105.t2